MDAPAGFCALCGQNSRDAHHITGRGLDHVQLDPTLTVDLCHRHHVLIHNDLRAQGIDTFPYHLRCTVLVGVEQKLRRIAVFIARYGQAADNPVWLPLAALHERLADDLSRFADEDEDDR